MFKTEEQHREEMRAMNEREILEQIMVLNFRLQMLMQTGILSAEFSEKVKTKKSLETAQGEQEIKHEDSGADAATSTSIISSRLQSETRAIAPLSKHPPIQACEEKTIEEKKESTEIIAKQICDDKAEVIPKTRKSFQPSELSVAPPAKSKFKKEDEKKTSGCYRFFQACKEELTDEENVKDAAKLTSEAIADILVLSVGLVHGPVGLIIATGICIVMHIAINITMKKYKQYQEGKAVTTPSLASCAA